MAISCLSIVFIHRTFSNSEKESQSNDTLLNFEEFSNVHNCDRSSNANRSNLVDICIKITLDSGSFAEWRKGLLRRVAQWQIVFNKRYLQSFPSKNIYRQYRLKFFHGLQVTTILLGGFCIMQRFAIMGQGGGASAHRTKKLKKSKMFHQKFHYLTLY